MTRRQAQFVVGIGHFQRKDPKGFARSPDSIRDPVEGIRLVEAIRDRSDPAHPVEHERPPGGFIEGNPGGLGSNKLPTLLGNPDTDAVHADSARRQHTEDMLAIARASGEERWGQQSEPWTHGKQRGRRTGSSTCARMLTPQEPHHRSIR